MSHRSLSIVIPAFNQLGYCRACIESIQRNTAEPYRLVLVDNGSTDGVGEYFDTIEGATVVHTGENLGFPGGSNRGLAVAEGHVVLLNSDTLVPEGWLRGLKHALFSADDVGLVGPMSNHAAGPQQIDGLSLRGLDEVNAFARSLAAEKDGVVSETHRLVAFCWMMRDTALESVGPFDESYGIGNYEDDDYCVRMRKAGYRLVIAEDCFVFHHGGRTFKGMGLEDEAFSALLNENRAKFTKKWGLNLPEPPTDREYSLKLNEQAQDALAEGRMQEAAAILKDAVAACPEEPRNYNDLGVVMHHQGKSELAFQCFVQALRADTTYEPARGNLRDVGASLGRQDEVRARLGE